MAAVVIDALNVNNVIIFFQVMVISMWCLLEIILLGALFLYATVSIKSGERRE